MPLLVGILGLLLLAAVFVLVRMASQPMSCEQFMSAVQRRIESRYPSARLECGDGFDCTLVVDGNDVKLSLEETHDQCCRHLRILNQIVDRYFDRILQLSQEEREVTWDDAKPQLFPQVRRSDFLETVRRTEGGEERAAHMAAFDLDIGLKVTLLLQSEAERPIVTKDDLKRWRVSEDEVKRCAVKNLESLTELLWSAACDRAKQHGFFRFDSGDGYDASRILLPELYQRVGRALGASRIAVLVPHRDLLAVFPADDEDAVGRARRLAAQFYATGDYPVSPHIFFFPKKE